MSLLLDTNIISYAISGVDLAIRRNFSKYSNNGKFSVSTITIAELYYGARKKNSHRLESQIGTFLDGMEVIEFDRHAALEFAKLRLISDENRFNLGFADLMIAACAWSKNKTLITRDKALFQLSNILDIDSWT